MRRRRRRWDGGGGGGGGGGRKERDCMSMKHNNVLRTTVKAGGGLHCTARHHVCCVVSLCVASACCTLRHAMHRCMHDVRREPCLCRRPRAVALLLVRTDSPFRSSGQWSLTHPVPQPNCSSGLHCMPCVSVAFECDPRTCIHQDTRTCTLHHR